MDDAVGIIHRLYSPKCAAVAAGIILLAAVWRLSLHPLQRERIEDRGRGAQVLAEWNGMTAGASMFGGDAWLRTGNGAASRWKLPEPIQSAAFDPSSGRLVLLPYMSNRFLLLSADQRKAGEARLNGVWGLDGPYTIGGTVRAGNVWYAAVYNVHHDGSAHKGFPFIFPIRMRFRWRIVRIPGIRPGMTGGTILYEGRSLWHEESAHPWVLRTDEDSDIVYVLNTMGEELSAHRAATGEEFFRIPTPSGPIDMLVFGPWILICAPESGKIAVYDRFTGAMGSPIPSGRGITALASAGGEILALSKYRRTLSRIRTSAQGWDLSTERLKGIPTAIAVDGGNVFIADGSEDQELSGTSAPPFTQRNPM